MPAEGPVAQPRGGPLGVRPSGDGHGERLRRAGGVRKRTLGVVTDLRLRPARTSDVPAIKDLVAPLARAGVLINKDTVAYYEGIQEFLVVEAVGDEQAGLVGCGALHVMWEDLGEVRTLATSDEWRGRGVGRTLLAGLIERARAVGVSRVFCLTFEVDFFSRLFFDQECDAPCWPSPGSSPASPRASTRRSGWTRSAAATCGWRHRTAAA